jgi:hypothetical protein
MSDKIPKVKLTSTVSPKLASHKIVHVDLSDKPDDEMDTDEINETLTEAELLELQGKLANLGRPKDDEEAK